MTLMAHVRVIISTQKIQHHFQKNQFFFHNHSHVVLKTSIHISSQICDTVVEFFCDLSRPCHILSHQKYRHLSFLKLKNFLLCYLLCVTQYFCHKCDILSQYGMTMSQCRSCIILSQLLYQTDILVDIVVDKMIFLKLQHNRLYNVFVFIFVFFLGIIKKAQYLMSQILFNISKNLVVVITHRTLGCQLFSKQ